MTTTKTVGILWDYDGVIVPSDQIKWRFAWEVAFAGEDKALICAARGILATAQGRHMPRGDVIDHVLHIADEQGISYQNDREFYLTRFGTAVQELIPQKGVIDGVMEVLNTLQKAGVVQYLISGTVQEDLDHTTKVLGVDQYMLSVRGGWGDEKIPHAREIVGLHPEITRWIAIGDQMGDKELADAVGAEFIGIASEFNGWWEQQETLPFPILRTAADVPKHLGI